MTNEIQRLRDQEQTLVRTITQLRSERDVAHAHARGWAEQRAVAVQRSRQLEAELQRRPTTEAKAQLEARVTALTAALEAEQQVTRRQANALAAAHGQIAALRQQVAALQQQRTAPPEAVPVHPDHVI